MSAAVFNGAGAPDSASPGTLLVLRGGVNLTIVQIYFPRVQMYPVYRAFVSDAWTSWQPLAPEYTLPEATATTLGGIKPDNSTVETDANGVLRVKESLELNTAFFVDAAIENIWNHDYTDVIPVSDLITSVVKIGTDDISEVGTSLTDAVSNLNTKTTALSEDTLLFTKTLENNKVQSGTLNNVSLVLQDKDTYFTSEANLSSKGLLHLETETDMGHHELDIYADGFVKGGQKTFWSNIASGQVRLSAGTAVSTGLDQSVLLKGYLVVNAGGSSQVFRATSISDNDTYDGSIITFGGGVTVEYLSLPKTMTCNETATLYY